MAPRRTSRLPLALLLPLLILPLLPASLGEIGERKDRRFLSNLFNRRPAPVEREDRSCSCTCGERNDATRIVGGKPAGANEFPWIVRLSYFNRFYCGGMLINDRYVLTAAHCVKGFMWFMIKVTFGEHDRCDKSFRPETRFVLRAITGDFSYLNFDNDIAILRLNDRVPMTETIRPICLPADGDDMYVGRRAIASGWGTLKEDGKPACILQQVEVPVMSNLECKSTNYSEKIISDNMLCAGYPEGLKDSCQGDSGGPLIREKEDKRYELIGVVSWGNGCARPGFPGIYTRVTRYLDWIRSNTAGGCWCEDPPRTPETTEDKEGVVVSAVGSGAEATAESSAGTSAGSTAESSAGSTAGSSAGSTAGSSAGSTAESSAGSTAESSAVTSVEVTSESSVSSTGGSTTEGTAVSTTEKPSSETQGDPISEKPSSTAKPTEEAEDKNKPEQTVISTSESNQTEKEPNKTEDTTMPVPGEKPDENPPS